MPPSPNSPLSKPEQRSHDASEDDSDGSPNAPIPRSANPTQGRNPDTGKATARTESTSRTRTTTANGSSVKKDSEDQPQDPVSDPSSPRKTTSHQHSRPPSQKSVAFSSGTSAPKPERPGSYSLKGGRKVSAASPAQLALADEMDGAGESSSADEHTAIKTKTRGTSSDYGAASAAPAGGAAASGAQDEGTGGLEHASNGSTAQQPAKKRSDDASEEDGWWKRLLDKYGSVELENKASVARDHLALERTFLAWLRTSLSFASIGIAVTQLFRLNTSLSSGGDSQALAQDQAIASSAMLASQRKRDTPISDNRRLRHVGKPLGATFLAISILVLLLGFHRYFESQHYVIRGKFPASRGTIMVVTSVAAALIVASLVVVVAVAPSAFET